MTTPLEKTILCRIYRAWPCRQWTDIKIAIKIECILTKVDPLETLTQQCSKIIERGHNCRREQETGEGNILRIT